MNKNIIITGASRGIGFELAKKALIEKNNVLVISRNENALNRLREYENRNQLKILPLDLSQTNSIHKVLEFIKDWKTVDVLYNNAGRLIYKPFGELKEEDFLSTWKVNFLAPAILIQTLLPKLNKDSHIINISTIGAVQGSVKFSGLSAYSSSKAALTNLTELLAEELKEIGISVNAICLGAVQTEMLTQVFPDFKAEVQPKDIASYLYDFGLNGYKFYNGKILSCSKSTP